MWERERVSLRILLAVNPHARRGASTRDEALALLRGRGHTVEWIEPRAGAHLSGEITRRAGTIDLVAVGGGDGTLIGAIDGLRQAGVPLLILPLGTINELARTLGIPVSLADACALADDGHDRRIDVGCVNGSWYFSEASIGLSTHVARAQTGEEKSRWGMLAIPIATARSLRALRPYHLEIEDETGARHRVRTVQLTVANSNRFGGIVETPDASIDDGRLDLFTIRWNSTWDAIGVIAAVARRRFPDAPAVEGLRGSRFIVRAANPRHRHHVFADGEPATTTPAEFLVVREAIAVRVPR
jgi:YegS/Rv2252/BmrU family lipid kinase